MIGARSRYLAFFCVPTPIGEIMGTAALLWGLWQACRRHVECSETLS
jgi:hypothetical protein